jgi:class 3 adenylate cyclase/CheY-like chemotaxis protein
MLNKCCFLRSRRNSKSIPPSPDGPSSTVSLATKKSLECASVLPDMDEKEPPPAPPIAMPKRSLDLPYFSEHTGNAGKQMIVCVDRKESERQIIRTILWEETYVIVFLRTWEELVVFLRTSELLPDVVLINVDQQEVKNFKGFIMGLRRTYSSRALPVLIIISMSMEAQISSVLKAGVNDYVIKPLKRIEIIRKLSIHISVRNNARTQKEADRYYKILNDVFPRHIISEMEKNQGTNIVESHACISVLFSDIVDFTCISSNANISQVVELLGSMFSRFDDICLAHDTYKVETIGDAYMIVCGHDGKHTNNHAHTLIKVGLEMLRAVREMKTIVNGHKVDVRIGIHTGAAYSGVIGKSRPRYCFFGDTINVASRMESHGACGKVHVSPQTYEHIKHIAGLHCTPVGPHQIKGKGEMTTYLVDTHL